MWDELKRAFYAVMLPLSVFAASDGLLALFVPALDAYVYCTGALGGAGLLLSIVAWRRHGTSSTGTFSRGGLVVGQAALAVAMASAAVITLIRWALAEASGVPIPDDGAPTWMVVALLLAADAIVVARAHGTHWSVSVLVPVAHAGALLCLFQYLVAYPSLLGAGGVVGLVLCRGAVRPTSVPSS